MLRQPETLKRDSKEQFFCQTISGKEAATERFEKQKCIKMIYSG